jgi:hypothetical protein
MASKSDEILAGAVQIGIDSLTDPKANGALALTGADVDPDPDSDFEHCKVQKPFRCFTWNYNDCRRRTRPVGSSLVL